MKIMAVKLDCPFTCMKAKRRRFVFPYLLTFLAGMLSSYLIIVVWMQWTLRMYAADPYGAEMDSVGVEAAGSILRRATGQLSFNDSRLHADDTAVADSLFKNIRILCLVMTYPANHQKRAIHVKATWGKRCNKLLFVTRTADENLTTLIVNVTDGRNELGDKTREAFDQAYKHYVDDYDWFLKADDDTYVIMENLRYFLSAQDHNSPVFFGQTFSKSVEERYASGGAGYIASRETLRRFGQRSNETQSCKFDSGYEDVDFGQCMASLGVKLGNSLDALGRTRFHCFDVETHLRGGYPDWYYSHDFYNGIQKGFEGLSDYAISFHYVLPDNMYFMEYFVYHLNPYGIIKGLQDLKNNANKTYKNN